MYDMNSSTIFRIAILPVVKKYHNILFSFSLKLTAKITKKMRLTVIAMKSGPRIEKIQDRGKISCAAVTLHGVKIHPAEFFFFFSYTPSSFNYPYVPHISLAERSSA